MVAGDRRVPERILQCDATAAAADDCDTLGADRQCVLAAALAGNRGQTNYAAAKAGLHGATKSLALELASRGITVNAIAPGIIASSMSDAAFTKAMIDQLVPMKRAGTPDEVADLASYLASERAGYISGQIISINGAMI